MDNNEILKQFDNIEAKVEKLIRAYRSLETNNSELTDRIGVLEKDLRQKTEAEELYKEQKESVRLKIDSLLGKLSDFTETDE